MTIDTVAFSNDVIGEMLHLSRNWTTQPGDNITPGFFVWAMAAWTGRSISR